VLIILLGVSVLFKLLPPKEINSFYGYRTTKSMSTIQNWKLANNYSSTLMIIAFLFLAILYFILDFFKIHFTYLFLGLIIFTFISVFFMTERKIKEVTKK